MHQFKELKVWQKGKDLVKEIYMLTHKFPKEELFGITSQMRRSAVSIPTNIAEGCGRNSNVDLNRFLDIANGSAFELETLTLLSFDLEFLNQENFKNLDKKINEVQKMIFGFKQSVLNAQC
ncbi:MAG: four helix bundle protein [Prolixibacteraceae bacterium]|nr:four helix bundle protein [Prolixibacteraceae bacterium]